MAADVSAAVAELAQELSQFAKVEKMATGSSQAEAGESPTALMEKAVAAVRTKRLAALTLLRPAAKTAPQWLLLAELEAAQAQDAYDQAVEAEAKAPKLQVAAVEAACAKGMAAAPVAEVARGLEYAWAMALESRGQGAEAAKHYRSALAGAPEPWRSEMLFRLGGLELAKDPAAAQTTWSQVSAMPYVVYASYRQTMELTKAGKCAPARDTMAKLAAAPELPGTSYVDVAAQAVSGCKAK